MAVGSQTPGAPPVTIEHAPNLIEQEYQQSWEDMRHRGSLQGTWFSIFIAINGALFYIISSLLDKISNMQFINGYAILAFVCLTGMLYSISAIGLQFGERRAWSADLECLSRLENQILSHQNQIIIGRIVNFDTLRKAQGYRITKTSAFALNVTVMITTASIWGIIMSWSIVQYLN